MKFFLWSVIVAAIFFLPASVEAGGFGRNRTVIVNRGFGGRAVVVNRGFGANVVVNRGFNRQVIVNRGFGVSAFGHHRFGGFSSVQVFADPFTGQVRTFVAPVHVPRTFVFIH